METNERIRVLGNAGFSDREVAAILGVEPQAIVDNSLDPSVVPELGGGGGGGGSVLSTDFPVDGGFYISGAPPDPPEEILTETFSVDADPPTDWSKMSGNDLVVQNGVMNAAGSVMATWTAAPLIDDLVVITAHFKPPVSFAAMAKMAVGFGNPASYQDGITLAVRNGNSLDIYGGGDAWAMATPLAATPLSPDPRNLPDPWLRLRRRGDTIFGDLFDEDPDTADAPLASVTTLLTGADATAYGAATTHKPRVYIGTIFRTDEPTRGVSDVRITQTFAGDPLSLNAVVGSEALGYVERKIIDLDGDSDFAAS